jgi:hypothetical protein
MVIKRYSTEKFLVLPSYCKTFFMAGNPRGASRLRDEQRVYWQIVCNTASAMFSTLFGAVIGRWQGKGCFVM